MKRQAKDKKFNIESPEAPVFPFLVLTVLTLGVGFFLFLQHLAYHDLTRAAVVLWGKCILAALCFDGLLILLFYHSERLWVRTREGRFFFTYTHWRQTKWTSELISYRYFYSYPSSWSHHTPEVWEKLESAVRSSSGQTGSHRLCMAEFLFENDQRLLLYDCGLPWQEIPEGWEYLSCGTYFDRHTPPPGAEEVQIAHAFDLVELIDSLKARQCSEQAPIFIPARTIMSKI